MAEACQECIVAVSSFIVVRGFIVVPRDVVVAVVIVSGAEACQEFLPVAVVFGPDAFVFAFLFGLVAIVVGH